MSVEPDAAASGVADRRSMAYSGTSVVGGRGEGIVVAIGAATEVGRIASGLTTEERRRSPLQRELDRLVRLMLVVAIGLIVVTSGWGSSAGNPLAENLLAGITAAIAADPGRAARPPRGRPRSGRVPAAPAAVLVRRLNAEEILGAIDLIVTDKTGTITQNRLDVASVDGRLRIDPDRRTAPCCSDALRAEDDAWEHGREIRDELVHARARAGGRRGRGDTTLEPERPGLGRPADRATAVRDDDRARTGQLETLILGAPEAVLDLATGHLRRELAEWHARIEALTSDGERVVALAGRSTSAPRHARPRSGSPIRCAKASPRRWRRPGGPGSRSSS